MSDSILQNKPIGSLPVLPVDNVETILAFYTEKLGFSEVFHQKSENGEIVNAQVTMSGSHLIFNFIKHFLC